jgi:hypothetical protein
LKDEKVLVSKSELKHSNSHSAHGTLRGIESSEKRDARSVAEKTAIAEERKVFSEKSIEGEGRSNSGQMMPSLSEESGEKSGERGSGKRVGAVPEDLREVYEQIQIHKDKLAQIHQSDRELDSRAPDDSNELERQQAKKMRAKKKAQADSRLREFIINQLRTRQFLAAERDKLMALLFKLGISEIEYRKLVVEMGEIEAQRHAAGETGYENKIALELSEEEAEHADEQDSNNASVEIVEAGGSVPAIDKKRRPDLPEAPNAIQQAVISRAELFERLRKE